MNMSILFISHDLAVVKKIADYICIMKDGHIVEQNTKENIMHSLLHTGERLGKLMGVTEKALDPKSPGGTAINNQEKDKIYKALKEVEEKIASLKKAIE